ncbi:MAG: DUF2971 domain-containing protein, partial [Chloroflexi bacterium]|nr:DUF2971 domain-containing protein [Chloroflexota bacterium]
MPFVDHEAFTPPDESGTKLWRYSSFGKLMSIITTGRLFFSKVSRFEDPYEGTLPRKTAELLAESDARAYVSRPGIDPPPRDRLAEGTRKFNQEMSVNCWCELPHESAAMWRLYSPSDEGIAIQTTFGGLTASLDATIESVYIGRVNYIDYEADEIPLNNALHALTHKRLEFEYEHKLRAVVGPYSKEESE